MLIDVGTCVLPSSGQVTITSICSPTDLPRIFKNKYSISNVESLSTLIPLDNSIEEAQLCDVL